MASGPLSFAEGSLYIFDLGDGQHQPLILADYDLQGDLFISEVAWSPKGNEIAISFSTRPEPEDTSMEAGCAILKSHFFCHTWGYHLARPFVAEGQGSDGAQRGITFW